MTTEHFDFLVLGGGSGGLAAARRAAKWGAKVALVEGGQLGGTCVNRGCIPKKMLWNAAQVADALSDAESYGFGAADAAFDWARFKKGRDAAILRLNDLYEQNVTRENVHLVRGWARLAPGRCLEVGDRRLTGEHLLLAPGGVPLVPDVAGAHLGITSDEFFELAVQPKNVAIVGAGYISVEMAGVLHALGTEVTLLVRGDAPLRSFDASIQAALTSEILSQGIALCPGFVPADLQARAGGLFLTSASGNMVGPFEQVIWAVGRSPRVESLDLRGAGVQTDRSGRIVVDVWETTTATNVYALGDVTGKKDLTPVAIAAGRKLADRLFGGVTDAKLDYENIPTVLFSHPPIATVGLSEEDAVFRHGAAVKCYSSSFVDTYYTFARRKVRTVVKVVTVGPDERVVGVHVFGRSADELIQGFAVAVQLGATKADFDRTVAVHPTTAEELVTLR